MNQFFKRWFCLVLIAICNCSGTLAAQLGSYSAGGSSWHSSGDSWRTDYSYREITGFQPKPKNADDYQVTFQNVALGTLGNNCTIKGKVEYDTKKKVKPVDWFQEIAVYLANQPGKSCDWSTGISSDAEHDSVVLNNDGTFEVRFDLRGTDRNPNKREQHQIGIALATHQIKTEKLQTATLKSSYPAVKSSVQMLEIPASKKVARELRLIDKASGWPFSDPDGTKLVRTVNALRPLGKKKALELLQQYVDSLEETCGEGDIVFWIIRVLFEPADLRQQIPSPAIAVLFNTGDKANHINGNSELWPLDPIELTHDVPFMLGRQIAMGGTPEHPNSHIRWAQKFGVIRDSPLKPKNPLLMAKHLLQSQKFKSLPKDQWDSTSQCIRMQAVTMCMPNVYGEISDAQWKRFLESAVAQKVWDPAKQEFAAPVN